MCGFTGFLQEKWNSETARQSLTKMTNALVHRGPDQTGQWIDDAAQVALGHQRLSIIDLSNAGRQPMVSHTGRYVIVFNGEIYNFEELRTTLHEGGYDQSLWHGRSDTEVVLNFIEHMGLEAALAKFIGMFAIAIYDQKVRRLTLARDRIGEKPLYYGWSGGVFLFGSELKSINRHPAFTAEINRDALALMIRHKYIPSPLSVYQGIYKLPAGHMLQIDSEAGCKHVEPIPYWSFGSVLAIGKEKQFEGNYKDAIHELEKLLLNSVKNQMVSDVPLGAFLSGGIDSSTIVAIMQAQSSTPVKTFTVGFHEEGYNEARHSLEVARHLKTDHHELYVSHDEMLNALPLLSQIYDEPFADPSAIPTFLISKLARESVTVSLSGDGGDELFGGYSRYDIANKIWNTQKYFPKLLLQTMAKALRLLDKSQWDRFSQILPFTRGMRNKAIGEKVFRFSEILKSDDPFELYYQLISESQKSTSLVIGATEMLNPFSNKLNDYECLDIFSLMMMFDTEHYLPDDILVKLDRASMANGLETRVPILDCRIIEFATSLPHAFIKQNGVSKSILREVLYKYVPKELVNSPKRGFSVPIDSWLRGPLKEWAEDLLCAESVANGGILETDKIQELWDNFKSGHNKNHNELWNILMIQEWLHNGRVKQE